MSHRIIIGSSRTAQPVTNESASIEININYTPAHHESDKVALRRMSKIMRLMRQMEEVIDAPDEDSEP